MSKNLILACGVALMVSCTATADKLADNVTAVDTAIVTVVAPSNTTAQDSTEIVNRVKAIYDHVGRLYSDRDYRNASSTLNKLYASARFNALVNAIADADKDIDGIGFFDFDYWVMGQDFDNVHVTDIFLEKMLNQPADTAAVTFNLHNCGSITPLRVELVKEDGQWQIDNFYDRENDLDLKAAMQDYLKKR